MNCLGLYIHVPFCAKKCPYCDFFSTPYSRANAETYLNAVTRNIKFYGDGSAVDTVYFGGGTPSLLTPEQIGTIMSQLRNCFTLADDTEITIEVNPSTADEKRLLGYKKAGISRLSFGVQSMNENELRFLGRLHSPERAEKAVLDAKNAGFENISCDLMIGLPNQSENDIKNSVEALSKLPITHISSYILKIEKGTPFYSSGVENMLPDDDRISDLYLKMCRYIEDCGFMQYEISNFAKANFQSRHNCRYWKCEDYLGIGPAAHSCYKGKRFAVLPDLSDFIATPHQNIEITEENPYSFEERAMLKLRLSEGLPLIECGEKQKDIRILEIEQQSQRKHDRQRTNQLFRFRLAGLFHPFNHIEIHHTRTNQHKQEIGCAKGIKSQGEKQQGVVAETLWRNEISQQEYRQEKQKEYVAAKNHDVFVIVFRFLLCGSC